MTRFRFSDAERRRRSRLAQIAPTLRLLRGTLSLRRGRCGKPHCPCTRGERHASLYLVQSHLGQLRQGYVPKAWEQRVRQAVQNHQEMQPLIEELSQGEWRRLRLLKAQPGPARPGRRVNSRVSSLVEFAVAALEACPDAGRECRNSLGVQVRRSETADTKSNCTPTGEQRVGKSYAVPVLPLPHASLTLAS